LIKSLFEKQRKKRKFELKKKSNQRKGENLITNILLYQVFNISLENTVKKLACNENFIISKIMNE
jgi:hypothetical protein